MLPQIALKKKRHVIQLIFLLWSKIGIARPAPEVSSPISLKSFLQYHLPQWGYCTIQCWTIVSLFLLISNLILSFCKLSQQQLLLSLSTGKTIHLIVVFAKDFFIYMKMVFVLTNKIFFQSCFTGCVLQFSNLYCFFLLGCFALLLNLLSRVGCDSPSVT